jgi:hypothetical protein
MSKYDAILAIIFLLIAAFFGSGYDEMYIWLPKFHTTLNGMGIVIGATFLMLFFLLILKSDDDERCI